MIAGDWWEPMDVVQGAPLPKGPLDPSTTALVIIDMQPLCARTTLQMLLTDATNLTTSPLPHPQFKISIHPHWLQVRLYLRRFYDMSSPWGAQGGLERSDMGPLWRKHMQLAAGVSGYTGRADAVFLTRYVTPWQADEV